MNSEEVRTKNGEDGMNGEEKKAFSPVIPAAVISAAAFAFFALELLRLAMLPAYMSAAAFALLALPAGLLCLLCARKNKTIRIIAFAAAMLYSLGLATVGAYTHKGISTLKEITSVPDTREESFKLYVPGDSSAEYISDISGRKLGILAEIDRAGTDSVLSEIESELGAELQTVEYGSAPELLRALMANETAAVILADYQLDLMAETEELKAIAEGLRVLSEYRLETVVGQAADTAGDSADKNPDVFSVYISGIDKYTTYRSRSDVNIIAFVNKKTHQILLLNTPRDYYVQTTVSGEDYDKLTHAGLFGVDCSKGTLENLYDIKIDYWFRVNFSGFIEIIDALGGIEVYAERENRTFNFDGEGALAHARNRGYAGGDRQRGRNQMDIIKAVINKLLSPALLTGFNDIMDSVSSSFESSVPYELISSLVSEQLAHRPEWDIVTASVSGESDMKYVWSSGYFYGERSGAYVMIPCEEDVEHAKELFRAIMNNEIISEP